MRRHSVVLAALLAGCGSSEDAPAPVPVADAAVDTATVADAGPDGEEVSTDSGVKCAPQPITGWTPKWYPPTGSYQGKCTAAEIHEGVVACFSPTATEATCKAAREKYPDCAACLVTDAYATSTGALVQYTDPVALIDRNVGGCFALKLGDSSKDGCGAKVRAAVDCGLQACGKACAPPKTLAALNGCITKANADPAFCKAHFDAAEKCELDNKDKVRDCSYLLTGEPVVDIFERYGALFCGTAPSGDAGTDAKGD